MKTHTRRFLPLAVGLLATLTYSGRASDHADPMSVIEPLRVRPRSQEPGITDLHTFLDNADPAKATALIVSLCVNRSLTPVDDKGRPIAPAPGPDGKQPPAPKPNLTPYTYKLHFNPNPELEYGDPAAVARYGAVIRNPANIGDPIQLEFGLQYHDKEDMPAGGRVTLTPGSFKAGGLTEPNKFIAASREDFTSGKASLQPGVINICTGIFDDPFIFPRFFRTNVVGIVVSIPLSQFPANPRKWLIWATTHDKSGQIDHVGRSLRTQLPRFGSLNTLDPRQHVAELQRIHEDPTILEDTLRTFVSPLFARRYYDGVPDVIVLNYDRPIGFPNGRLFTDDVSKILADTGETLLFELSYTDSTLYPRATENDGDARVPKNPAPGQPTTLLKPFKTSFPYLADPWTQQQAKEYPRNGMLPGAPKLASKTISKIIFIGILALIFILALFAFLIWIGWRLGRGARQTGPSGPQGISVDDTQYQGSSVAQIWGNVSAAPYEKRWEKPGQLPVYQTTLYSVLRGILPFGRPYDFARAQRRTLASSADLRPGPDGKGFRRLLHPNGICLKGRWIIDSNLPSGTAYTGLFAPGSQALIVGRYSTCCTETRSGHNRSLSLVAKLFNTSDENKTLVPASLITQEDLGGTRSKGINDVLLTNAPNTTAWRRGFGLPVFIVTVITFFFSDKKPSIRQLYQIAELGKSPDQKTSTPNYIQLSVASKSKAADNLDFRDEILSHFYEPGADKPTGSLEFDIEVADEARFRWFGTRVQVQNWTRIGRIVFDDVAASYNADHVIHFHHPVWRNDVNDPNSVARHHEKV